MPVQGVDAYPLYWPEGWSRTRERTHALYQVSFAKARDDLMKSMKKMGVPVEDLVISTNIPIRRDGLPYANMPEPVDPGVAVYWTRKKKPQVIACDRWRTVRDNMRAVWCAVEALRTLDRCGASEVIERAFAGFTALPANAGPSRAAFVDVLGVELEGLTFVKVDEAWKRLAARLHPDRPGGSHEAMVQLDLARREAIAYLTERQSA